MKNKEQINILVLSYKGGVGATTNARLIADFLGEAINLETMLIGMNSDNKAISGIGGNDFEEIVFDFRLRTYDSFIEFESLLYKKGLKVIDVDSVKFEIFHQIMSEFDLYSCFDLIIVPSMHGKNDYEMAFKYLDLIKDKANLKEKVLFSFNRFNEYSYQSLEKQFSFFYDNIDTLKERFGLSLNNRCYYIKDSYVFKEAEARDISVKKLMNMNINKIKVDITNEDDEYKRLELIRERDAIINARAFYKEYLSQMIKIVADRLNS